MNRPIQFGASVARAVNLAVAFTCVMLSPPGFAQEIPTKLLQEEFCIMRDALEEAHGGIYRYTTKAEMDRTFDRAYQKIDHAMTDREFWRLVAPVVAHIKCGHTAIWLPKTVQAEITTKIPLLPLVVRMFSDRVYIYRDLSSRDSSLEGSEILSINGEPVKDLRKTMTTFVTGDGNTTTAKAWRLGHNNDGFIACLYALGIESSFSVVCRKAGGKRITAKLMGMTITKQNE